MSFDWPIQKAIYERLSTYPSMPPVLDVPDTTATHPYIVIGEDTHVPFDTDDSVGSEATVTLHIWSRQRGKKETKTIQGLIYDALNRYELPVDGYDTITVEFDYSDVVRDPDGLTHHGVSRFRLLVETTA